MHDKEPFDLLIDVRMIQSSGIGVYLRALLPEALANFNVALWGDADVLRAYSWTKGVPVIHDRTPIYGLAEQWAFYQKLPPSRVCWSPHYNMPLLAPRVQKRLVTVHDVNHLAGVAPLAVHQRLYAWAMLREVTKKASAVVCVSEFSASQLWAHFPDMRCEPQVIYNGLDLSAFNTSYERPKDLPENYILFVGNLKPHKNVGLLLDAFSHSLASRYPDLHLVLVGDFEGLRHPDKTLGEKIKRHADRIHAFSNLSQSRLIAFYQHGRVFAFPSLYEGFGFPPLEAMASGCPAVVSDIPCLREICGSAVDYMSPHSAESCAQRLACVLDEPQREREARIQKGRAHCERYPWSDSIRKHLNMLDDLLRES